MLPQDLLVQLLDGILGWHGRDRTTRIAMLGFLQERTVESGFALTAVLDAKPKNMWSEGAVLGKFLRATRCEIKRVGGAGEVVFEGYGEHERLTWAPFHTVVESMDG
jgi:hypothetical protein